MEASAFFLFSEKVAPLHLEDLDAILRLSGDPPAGPFSPPKEGKGETSEAERTVLLIDDELDSLEAVRELVESEGVRVWTAVNGQEALDLLRRGKRPSLIVLDLRMPRMDGWEFCRVLESDEALAGIPIAIVTASASFNQLPARRQDAGYFLKPIDFDAFLRVVKQYCG
jgi:CheY-like chemotaxis protein